MSGCGGFANLSNFRDVSRNTSICKSATPSVRADVFLKGIFIMSLLAKEDRTDSTLRDSPSISEDFRIFCSKESNSACSLILESIIPHLAVNIPN